MLSGEAELRNRRELRVAKNIVELWRFGGRDCGVFVWRLKL